MDARISPQITQIDRGHLLLLACVLLYLAWWIIFFRPADAKPAGAIRTIGIACIALAFITGIIGVAMIATGSGALPQEMKLTEGWYIWVGGIAAYLILLAITYFGFHRQVTSELILMVGWGVLELTVLNALWGTGALAQPQIIALAVGVFVVLCASVVCYVLYYNLPAMPSFIDGCIPLATASIVVAFICAMLA